MPDTNEIRFSGTIERLQRINTKTGSTMARWFLKVGQNRFGCVAFGNIAAAILKCEEGTRVSVSGSGKINSWKTDDETWRNVFQLAVWGIEIHGKKTAYEKSDIKPDQCRRVVKSDQGNKFDYTGGPF